VTSLTADDARTFERCMAAGCIAVFPADTVYGLACDPEAEETVRRLYLLKGRAGGKPAAVMFFSLELALAAVPELGPRTRAVLEALMPGAVTALVPNPAGRFAPACGDDPSTLGLRVPALPPALAALHAVRCPIMQSSANASGAPDARRVADVPAPLRDAADLVLDGGRLPGTPSTVLDLRAFEATGQWSVVRAGAVDLEALTAALCGL